MNLWLILINIHNWSDDREIPICLIKPFNNISFYCTYTNDYVSL